MGKRLPHTPSSQIRSAIRRLWLRSRERAKAMRTHQNACACCGRKQSKAKGKECSLEVHHISGATNFKEIETVIRKNLLVNPDELEPLCSECHKKRHAEGK